MSVIDLNAISHESMEPGTMDDTLSALMVEDIVDTPSEEELILPYMQLLYLRSQHILKIARTLRLHNVPTVYIARQTLRLVLQLNKTICAEGLNDELRRERNNLEEELIILEQEIENYSNDLFAGTESEAQYEYEKWGLKMQIRYDMFFKTRSYFSNAQEPSKDKVFPKLLAYDCKAAALMDHPSFILASLLLDTFWPSSDFGAAPDNQTIHTPVVIPPPIIPPAPTPVITPAFNPPAFNPPSVDPPSVDPPSVDPPSVDPPSVTKLLDGKPSYIHIRTDPVSHGLLRPKGGPLPLPHLQTQFPQRPQIDRSCHWFVTQCFLYLDWEDAEYLRARLVSVLGSDWWRTNTESRETLENLHFFVRDRICLFCDHRYQSNDQAMRCVYQHINFTPP